MTRVRQSCMPHSVREGVLHFMGRHIPQESDANTVIFLPRSLAQLRVFVGVLCSTQPRPPVHTVIIHGSGDFRGALARALTSSISWCQVGWLTLRMGSCFGLGEATVCRLLQHLQEEAVNLGEFILELPGVSMGDTIARQISGLLRARSRTLRCCALGLQSNQMMSHDGVWVYFSGLAFLVLAEVSLDQGVPPPLEIYPGWGDGSHERSCYLQSHAHTCVVGFPGDGPLCQYFFWGILDQSADAIRFVHISSG